MRALPRSSPLVPACRPVPATRFLSNGRYRVLITAEGSGASMLDGLSLTRWRRDAIANSDGFFVYLRDLDDGTVWSAGSQPTGVVGERYDVHWQPGVFTIENDFADVETRQEICVTPDDNAELRTLTLSNRSARRRRIELTTFAEVVLEDATAFAAHPTFSKLFVETEHVAGVVLARRRPRTPEKTYPWMVHTILGATTTSFETDRARFLGRCARPEAPLALRDTKLSESTGIVLDPISCMRTSVDLGPGERRQVTCLLGAAPERSACLALAERYTKFEACEAAFDAARSHARHEIEQCELEHGEAEYFQSLAGALCWNSPAFPHIVLDAKTSTGEALERQLRRARRYWRALAVPIELRVLDDDVASEDSNVRAAACLVVENDLPDLASDVDPESPPAVMRRDDMSGASAPRDTFDQELEHDNGYGGFAAQGREYVIRLPRRSDGTLRFPPRPWINVVANEEFGFLLSESGAGYTWSRNSRQHRLTPWSNDPVLDPHGEAFYVRDDASGEFWSPFPGPTPAEADYEIRHGFGYSLCSHTSHDLEQCMRAFVPRDAPLKVTSLRVRNTSSRSRLLSVFAYYQLDFKPQSGDLGRPLKQDPDSGAMLAQHPRRDGFTEAVVFAAVVQPHANPVHHVCDRTTFLGRNGHTARPAALCRRSDLEDQTAFATDACIAQQVRFRLEPNATYELSFILGEAESVGRARDWIRAHASHDAIESQLERVHEFWRRGLSGVQIETPMPAIDLMVNGWLPYQTLSCRLWARSAFYQSGGAFGFRDQLQDAVALVTLWPDTTRRQILRHAAQQFPEGDVLHWWHPPAGPGVRTRCVDDLVWLPWAVARYVRVTDDWGVLEENVGFVRARQLKDGEDEALLIPRRADETADLYDHCCLALDRALSARSVRGLPLFGSGDWNDGMNRVGRQGRGESVWMGFFLHDVLGHFIPLCDHRDDSKRARMYATERRGLAQALETHAWDGAWYRRGWYDSGAVLGSTTNDECVIDALVQAWAVLSNAAPHERAVQALQSVERHLVSESDGLIRLLWPPFENTREDPGYIKGYARGVRENGGQYTHAALWVVGALAALGRNDRVAHLLEMLSPVSHTTSRARTTTYGLEPYVVAADVYGAAPHVGRGGWSWYTGSAGWMYRIALESLLGLDFDSSGILRVRPCIPDDWPGYKVHYRFPGDEAGYDIVTRNPHNKAEAVVEARLDGESVQVDDRGAAVPLLRDGRRHVLEVVLGPHERR